MKIVISPWSRTLRNGKENPKNYPYWKELVELLKKEGHHIIQVGINGEKLIGTDEVMFNLSVKQLQKLILENDTWISVDNFFQHLAWSIDKKGLVIFGQSDPIIFGHNTNVNVLKGRECLRNLQFDIWERAEYRKDVFASPEEVIKCFGYLN